MMSEDERYERRSSPAIGKYYDLVMAIIYMTVGIIIAFDFFTLGYTNTIRWVFSVLFILYSLFRGYRFINANR